ILIVFILLQPRLNFWAIFATKDQCVFRAGADANGRKAFCQSGLSAEITFICHFSDRVKVANLVRTSANAITAADALRFFYPHDPLLITPRRPRRANVDARSIFAVLT